MTSRNTCRGWLALVLLTLIGCGPASESGTRTDEDLQAAIEAREAWLAAGRGAGPELGRFREVFLAVRASSWDSVDRAEVELDGYEASILVPEAAEHPRRTVELIDRVLARHPDSRLAREQREVGLPLVLEHCGEPCDSIARLQGLSAKGPAIGRLLAGLSLGDELAAVGRVDDARAALAGALEIELAASESERFPTDFYREQAKCRLARLGSQLAVGEIVGDDSGLLADARERVLVLDFWATWCLPCLAGLPTLQALHDRGDERLLVVGVTRPFERGFLPAGPESLRRGEAVPAIEPEDYPAHLLEFRRRAGLSFPSIVSDAATLEHFGASRLPRTYVLAPDGSVAFCSCSNGDDAQIVRTVDRLLSESMSD